MNTVDKNAKLPSLFPITAIDIYALKDKYSKLEEFNLNKAHTSLQELFLKFGGINLLMEKQPLLEMEYGEKFKEYMKNFEELSSMPVQALEEMSNLTSLYVQLDNCSKGSAAYKQTVNSIKEANRKSKRFERKYSYLSKQSKVVYDEMLLFTKKKKRYNFFGFLFKIKLFLVKTGLLLAAILFTLTLDRLGWFIDEELKYNYLYHVVFFLLFALIDRLIISPIEEKFSVQLSKKIFFDGIVFLEKETEAHRRRYAKNVNDFRVYVDNMNPVTF